MIGSPAMSGISKQLSNAGLKVLGGPGSEASSTPTNKGKAMMSNDPHQKENNAYHYH